MTYHFDSDEELKLFIADNIVTTMEAADIMKCSRQNIDDLVRREKLTPLKQTQRDKLFWKADILARVLPTKTAHK